MSLPEFRYFLALPLELRQEIYRLATPPRFVEVRRSTEQDYDEFAEHIRATPNAIRLDESLTHFSFNWRSQIPSRTKQRTLERYGFSSTKSPYQPWNVSKLAPQISLDWLSENPAYAWELCREGHMFSNAPIPALLHTCRESRDHLIKRGYQLAFRTRSHGPRTWFNFETDVLFISQGDDWGTKHRMLSGCVWDIGQFHPIDMQKVKRIALDNSTGSLYLSHPSFSERNYKFSDLSSVLRLFQHLKELLLVEWTDLYMDEIRPWNISTAKGQKRHSYDTQYLWSYQPVSEVDASLQMFPPKDYSNTLVVTCIGPYGELLKHHKTLQRNGYFDIVQNCLQDKLVKSRNSVVSRHKPDVDLWWEIPKVTAVHVMSNWGHEHLGRAREEALSRAYELRQKWLAEEKRRHNPLSHGQVYDFEADEEAFNLVLESEDPFEAQRTWWIRQGIIAFIDE
ncbi:hypothetical protein J7337_009233 [Fusarium musae]|uniref:2EXR domain-containing protein n=1 Tax=Fusarium musae TaxID=1042133 RepID=A0A9P8IML4_9HYPO|nr:hypothetical protein J7337_009233 [Fusarium musae]KAG9498428.1 hypothetical protein J7337_009233 [Fusarium musae]